MDEGTSIRDWLAALPANAEIAWNDNHIGAGFIHATASWLDIQVPMAEKDLSLNWIWTIDVVEDPDHYDFENDGGDAWVKSEGYIFIVCDTEKHVLLALACYDDGRVGEVPKAEVDHLVSSWGPITKGKHPVWLCHFADMQKINQALVGLATEGGRPDISFRYEPEIGPSPMLQDAEEMVEKLRSGEATTVKCEFDNPDWLVENFGYTPEEAAEHIAESEKIGKVLRAEIDRIRDRHRRVARRLLKRFAGQI